MESTPFFITCPKCGSRIRLENTPAAGTSIICPACKTAFPLTEKPVPPQPPQIEASDSISSRENFLPESLDGKSEAIPAIPIPEKIRIAADSALPEQIEINPAKTGSKVSPPIPPIAVPGPQKEKNAVSAEEISEDSSIEDEDDGQNEENPFWTRPLFLFGLGIIIALLVMILVLVLKQPRQNPAVPAIISNDTAGAQEQAADRLEEPVPAAESAPDLGDFDPNGSGIDLTEHSDEPAEETPEEASPDLTEDSLEETDSPAEGNTAETDTAEPNTEKAENESSPNMEEAPAETTPAETAPAENPVIPDLPAVELNIPERLALPIESVQLTNWSLPAIVQFLSNMTQVPITIRFDTFASFPMSADSATSILLEKTTAGELLEKTAQLFDLEIKTYPDRLELCAPLGPSQNQTFDLSDLLKSEYSAASGTAEKKEIASHYLPPVLTPEAIQQFLSDMTEPVSDTEPNESESAVENTLEISDSSLTASGSRVFINRISQLIELLRTLRTSPQEGPNAEETFSPFYHQEKLQAPLPLNFLKPVTLSEGLALFEEALGVTVLTDKAVLRQAGISEQTRLPFRSEPLPAYQVLTEYLSGYGLTWGMPNSEIILVTTKERGWTVTSIFRCPDESPDGVIPPAVLQLLESNRTRYWIDPASGSLIVQADTALLRSLVRILTAENKRPADEEVSREAPLPQETAPQENSGPAEPISE